MIMGGDDDSAAVVVVVAVPFIIAASAFAKAAIDSGANLTSGSRELLIVLLLTDEDIFGLNRCITE
jgi:hypothetical protein